MKASWESIARILDAETVSDTELAGRLGCRPAFVARVRADLRLPPNPGGPAEVPDPEAVRRRKEARARARLKDLTERVAGGHLRWDGPVTKGTPRWSSRTSALRVVFRLTHGREPEGNVRERCGFPHCVEGTHLADRRMREEKRAGGAR